MLFSKIRNVVCGRSRRSTGKPFLCHLQWVTLKGQFCGYFPKEKSRIIFNKLNRTLRKDVDLVAIMTMDQ